MLAHVGTLDDLKNPHFIFEHKVDGVRALAFFTGKKYFLVSRNNLDITDTYLPEDALNGICKARSCVLDGEIVALNTRGVSSFELLQKGKGKAQYVIFDILEKNGRSLIHKSLLERKKILADTVVKNKFCRIIKFTHDGPKLWKTAKQKRWEGVMAKVEDGLYHAGTRSYTWLKIKQHQTIDCIIVGYKSKKRTIASLALGLYDSKKKLHYIGNVGTGFAESTLEDLERRLRPIVVKKKPVVEEVKETIWVRPKFVAEIKFQEITDQGKLRIPAFVRLRLDKKAAQATMKQQDFKIPKS